MVLTVNPTQPTCHNSTNGSITAQIVGGTSPYRYLYRKRNSSTSTWSSWITSYPTNNQSYTISNFAGGNEYEVYVIDACNNFTRAISGVISAPTEIVVTLSSVSIKGVCKVTATATGGSPFFTYQKYNFFWQTSPNVNVYPVYGMGSSTISVPAGTSVTVTVVDSRQCYKQKNIGACPVFMPLNEDNEVSEGTIESITEDNINYNENFIIYPNPTNEKINIDFSYDEKLTGKICLYNSMGELVRVIKDGAIEKEIHNIDISEFAAGVYYVAIRTDKWAKTERLVIQK